MFDRPFMLVKRPFLLAKEGWELILIPGRE
jgi:hypothetical protein